MAAWTKRLGRDFDVIAALRTRPGLKRAAVSGGYFIMGLAMGAGRLFDRCGPFGIAAVAAVGSEFLGLVCLAGVTVGYLLAGGLFSGIRYIATALLVFTVGFVTRGVKAQKTDWFMPVITAVITGAAGLLTIEGVIGGVPGVMRVFMEVILSGGCAFFFRHALESPKPLSEAAELKKTISIALSCACGLMGLAGISLFGALSIGRFLAMVVTMAAGFCGGPLPGCAAGAAMGVAMDMAGGASLFFTAAYAIAGLFAGALYRYGRLTFAVSFCAGNAVAVLLGWNDGAHIPALYECFAATVVFMLLPTWTLAPVGSLLRVGRGRGETAFRLYQARRMEALSEGFGQLYASAAKKAPERSAKAEVGAVFDRAADVICRSCDNKEQCWKKDYAETARSLSSMVDGMSLRGTVSVSDLPIAFRQKCVTPGAFAGAVNGELRGLMYRRQYAARLREGRAAAYGQFADMAAVMSDAACQLSGAAGPDEAAERRLIRFLKSRGLEGACSAFRDGRGRLHAALEGAEVEALTREPDYLERLSEAVGVRLCRVDRKEKGRVALRQAEPLAVSVGIASMRKEGESVSGDRGTYFKTDSGMLCVILSDGMGTGEEAAGESACAVEILEGLLKAGVEPGCAMRLLNASAMLQNGEDWGYATVDLCCIDLFTGEAGFYKYGAAPSYVKAGRNIRRVKCTSLAAGMLAGEEAAPDVMRLRLRPGHVALIASDGVLAERDDQWLRNILVGCDGTETKDIARQTLKAAAARFGNADDMTALAIRVEERL